MADAAALERLRVTAAACTKCPLAEGRTQVVFGVGSPDADLLFVNRWDPTALDPDALHAVRDRWWNPGVHADSRQWGLPFGHYFNSGLLVLNRQLHLPLLRAAADTIIARFF